MLVVSVGVPTRVPELLAEVCVWVVAQEVAPETALKCAVAVTSPARRVVAEGVTQTVLRVFRVALDTVHRIALERAVDAAELAQVIAEMNICQGSCTSCTGACDATCGGCTATCMAQAK